MVTTTQPPRPVAVVMAAIATVGARRHEHVVTRDQRNADMLRALYDVEAAERMIADRDVQLEQLFDERARAIAAEASRGRLP